MTDVLLPSKMSSLTFRSNDSNSGSNRLGLRGREHSTTRFSSFKKSVFVFDANENHLKNYHECQAVILNKINNKVCIQLIDLTVNR